jgi:hypothetical protein
MPCAYAERQSPDTQLAVALIGDRRCSYMLSAQAALNAVAA